MTSSEHVLYGPDVNHTRSPLDKKLYRQIILKKNGLRAVLISDTLAMGQDRFYDDFSDSSSEEGSQKSDRHESKEKENDEDSADEDSSDEEDDGLRKAAAALVVGAGSFHDPPCVEGMAHFLEHMLFMGTKKYPGENEYSAFLSRNGGSDNAYTELEHTMYHFEICQEKLFKALDMLAQFIISPILSDDAVSREVENIDSEFFESKNSDLCRLQEFFCHECKTQRSVGKRHPFGNFSWGNTESLQVRPKEQGVDIMKELRQFFDQNYYAQNISLVVIGAYSLDQIEKEVVKYYSDVPALPRGEGSEHSNSLEIRREQVGSWNAKAYTPIRDFGMPFHNESLGHICRLVPVRDKHSLYITWQVPPQWENWSSKPCDYIAHLLGHESQGSILSALKQKSWVNGCYAGLGSGGYENASSHALFQVQFTLSEEGVLHWNDIVCLVYQYIGMLRYYCEKGLPTWIYEELRAMGEMAYKYEDESSPEDTVVAVAERLVPYESVPPEHILDGYSLFFEFDGEAIKDLVEKYIVPMNARVDLVSSTFGRDADFLDDTPANDDEQHEKSGDDCTDFSVETAGSPKNEPIFGTRYWRHKIPNQIIQKWNEAMKAKLPPQSSPISLPQSNPFIPSNFELKKMPADDSHHPLLFCSLKICVSIGKKKSWFPCSATKYDGTKNRMLLSYEDETQKWHKIDINLRELKDTIIIPDFEGTLDNKAIKFKVLSVPKDGERAILKYGDDSDWHVEEGIHFPPIPPASTESRLPSLFFNTQILKIWHLQDCKFKRPCAELRLKVVCGEANKTPLHRACAELFCLLYSDAMTETCYMASVCELGSSISSTDIGFNLRFHGFNDKLLLLAEETLDAFFSFNSYSDDLPICVKPGRFQSCLEILLRRYGNTGLHASSLATDVRLRCLLKRSWSANLKADALRSITTPAFLEIMRDLFKKISIEALFYGNVDKSDAVKAKDIISKSLEGLKTMPKKKHPKQEVRVAPLSPMPVILPTINGKEPNTAVEIYFQVGQDNATDRSMLDLLCQMMYEPFYDQVRTKEKFGYSVSCASRWTHGITGLCFLVTTKCKSAAEVTERVERFLLDFREDLMTMKDDVFMENVVGLAKTKLEKFNSLEDECNILWSEIMDYNYEWEAWRNDVLSLRSMTKGDVLNKFDQWLSPKSTSRRILIVQAIGTTEGAASNGRPEIEPDDVWCHIDNKVKAFHTAAGHTTWGVI